MSSRRYINTTEDAQATVEEMVSLVTTGAVRPVVGLDVETSPLPGLEGYHGTRRQAEKFVKATKDEYLRFAQKVWRSGWNPVCLADLGLNIPQKTTSGKEAGIDAKEAWKQFFLALTALMETPEGRAKLENARWTREQLQKWERGLIREANTLRAQRDAAEAELVALRARGVTRGTKKLEQTVKKSQAAVDAINEKLQTEIASAEARIEQPLDLRLACHVVCVGVEGRIFLTKDGRNRLDPVQPGLDPYTSTVFLVQFSLEGANGEQHYIFNTHSIDIKLLSPFLKLKKVLFVGANIKFDLKMLMHHAGFAPRNVYCVRVGSRLLYLGLRIDHDLKSLAARFIKRDLTKEVRNDFVGRRYEEPTPEMLEYAYVDTEVLLPIYDEQYKRAQGFGQLKLLQDFSALSWITAYWEHSGYCLDAERWMEINAEAAKARDEVARELEMMLISVMPSDNMGNNAETEHEPEPDDEDEDAPAVDERRDAVIRISQSKLVLGRLELLLGSGALGQYCPNGKPSLSKDARAAMERAYRQTKDPNGHPFFQLYARWAKLAKQVSTYGKRFLWYVHPLTGRIHPTFHIAGTDTGRYSSTGPNLLNIPAAKEDGDPDFRGAFIAPEGRLILGADFETMELRIAGDISRDPVVKKMVESGADAHGFTAAQKFHIEKTKVTSVLESQGNYRRGTTEVPITVFEVPDSWSSEQVAQFALTPEVQSAVGAVNKKLTRGDAKSVTFLWLFQGTPFTLAQRTGLPLEVCEDFFVRFSSVYTVMDNYMKSLAETVHTNYIEGNDGKRYSWAEGYGGIRRWVQLPQCPNDREYHSYGEYVVAAREYRRQLRRVQRELCNLPMQGGNAVITAEALLKIVERGHRYGVLPFLSIYDEILVSFPATVNPATVKSILEGSMLEAADRYMTYIPAGAEADLKKLGSSWVKS